MAVPPPIDPEAPRFLLDSSVILAGVASSAGASHALLTLGELGFIRLLTMEYIFLEIEKNIEAKFKKSLPRYLQVRTAIHWEFIPNPSLPDLLRWTSIIPVKDAPILAAAVSSVPARLVTLDTRHFIDDPRIAEQSGITIVTPGHLVREIRAALSSQFH